jgi:hypothetical protein
MPRKQTAKPAPTHDAIVKVLDQVMQAQERKPDEFKAKQLRLLEALRRKK